MAVAIEDIEVLVNLYFLEHGDEAECRLNDYIEQLERSGDAESASLWRRVVAVKCLNEPYE